MPRGWAVLGRTYRLHTSFSRTIHSELRNSTPEMLALTYLFFTIVPLVLLIATMRKGPRQTRNGETIGRKASIPVIRARGQRADIAASSRPLPPVSATRARTTTPVALPAPTPAAAPKASKPPRPPHHSTSLPNVKDPRVQMPKINLPRPHFAARTRTAAPGGNRRDYFGDRIVPPARAAALAYAATIAEQGPAAAPVAAPGVPAPAAPRATSDPGLVVALTATAPILELTAATKSCPDCAETVSREATTCPSCDYRFTSTATSAIANAI